MNASFRYFLGSFFFSGSAPRLKGTIGTAVPALIVLLLEAFFPLPWWSLLLAAALVFLISLPVAHETSIHDDPDPGWFVLDEVAGYLLILGILTPFYAHLPFYWHSLAAFCWFRIYDIFKPWPIQKLEKKISGGLGIMIDDIFAALYAWPMSYGMLLLIDRIREQT